MHLESLRHLRPHITNMTHKLTQTPEPCLYDLVWTYYNKNGFSEKESIALTDKYFIALQRLSETTVL